MFVLHSTFLPLKGLETWGTKRTLVVIADTWNLVSLHVYFIFWLHQKDVGSRMDLNVRRYIPDSSWEQSPTSMELCVLSPAARSLRCLRPHPCSTPTLQVHHKSPLVSLVDYLWACHTAHGKQSKCTEWWCFTLRCFLSLLGDCVLFLHQHHKQGQPMTLPPLSGSTQSTTHRVSYWNAESLTLAYAHKQTGKFYLCLFLHSHYSVQCSPVNFQQQIWLLVSYDTPFPSGVRLP